MDPNIMGRVKLCMGRQRLSRRPELQRIVVLGLRQCGTYGNAVGDRGCGLYDIGSKRDAIDYEASYANSIASCIPLAVFTTCAGYRRRCDQSCNSNLFTC